MNIVFYSWIYLSLVNETIIELQPHPVLVLQVELIPQHLETVLLLLNAQKDPSPFIIQHSNGVLVDFIPQVSLQLSIRLIYGKIVVLEFEGFRFD